MLLVAPVKEELHIKMTQEQEQLFGIDKLNIPRSKIPAVTHVDYSARIQTVHKETNSRYVESRPNDAAFRGKFPTYRQLSQLRTKESMEKTF